MARRSDGKDLLALWQEAIEETDDPLRALVEQMLQRLLEEEMTEFLCLVAEAYGVTATGIDLSPYTIKAARRNVEARGLADRIELLHADGGQYEPNVPESLDLASCIGEVLGLALLYTLVANPGDWDRYEGLQWQAAERYAADHPDDPDVEALLRNTRRSRDAYLRWGRNCLGWAMYLFRKP